jgi:hypothetical protein
MSFGSLAIEDKPIASVFEPSKAISVASPFGIDGQSIYDKFLSARRLKEEERDVVYDVTEDILWQHISSVSSRDAEFHHLYSKSVNTHGKKVKLELLKHINHMIFADEVFSWFLDQPFH